MRNDTPQTILSLLVTTPWENSFVAEGADGLLPVSAAPRSAQVASAHPFHKQPLLLKKEASGTSRKEALGKGQCSNYYPVTTEIEVCL